MAIGPEAVTDIYYLTASTTQISLTPSQPFN